LISPLPSPAAQEFNESRSWARDAYQSGHLPDAIAEMTRAYDRLVSQQPDGHRYHKGFPLYQLGLWALEAHDIKSARNHILAAFVEDSLSRGEESPQDWDELGRPAALSLVQTFSIPGLQLIDLAARLRKAQAEGSLFRTPGEALEAVPLATPPSSPAEATAARLLAPEPEPFAPVWRELGDFGTPLGRRVFIGGSYSDHLAPALRTARDEARACGWDGVLVAEFNAPAEMNNRTKSLICLMSCRRAIFELSESGGHLVEFDKLMDFDIRQVLVVYNAEVDNQARISSLTTAWFPDLHVQPRGYRGLRDLKRIIREWLSPVEPGAQN
jgi:hypothetical protein